MNVIGTVCGMSPSPTASSLTNSVTCPPLPGLFSVDSNSIFTLTSPAGSFDAAACLYVSTPSIEYVWRRMPSPSTHRPKPPMKSANATITPSAPDSGTTRSAAIEYERPKIRGIMPHITFCTSPANVNVVCVGSGGRIP